MSLWNGVIYVAAPAVVIVAGLIPLVVALHFWQWKRKRLRRQSPLTKDLLRPAGHSLRDKIEEATGQFVLFGILSAFFPLLVYTAYVSHPYFGGQKESAFAIVFYLVVVAAVNFIFVRKMLAAIEKRRTYVLGLDGELATGEELNLLMLHGCRVFHDVPGRWGNVDHVVVAPTGVYSVETKMKEKHQDEDRHWELVVDYSRSVLKFPGWEEPIPIEQPERQARELSAWLSKAVGEPVKVFPIIALPGWFIKERIGRWTVPVINPSTPHLFFLKQHNDSLTPQRIEQIAYQLEQVCRDVEPTNKRT